MELDVVKHILDIDGVVVGGDDRSTATRCALGHPDAEAKVDAALGGPTAERRAWYRGANMRETALAIASDIGEVDRGPRERQHRRSRVTPEMWTLIGVGLGLSNVGWAGSRCSGGTSPLAGRHVHSWGLVPADHAGGGTYGPLPATSWTQVG